MKPFMRLRILLGIAALAGVLAAVIVYASPYAPVVQPVMDIEAIWAIEDTRIESEEPLITALENCGMPLAYDAQENTFYCTLGLDQGEAWPQIHLTAPHADGIELVFVDDYSYDWCSDAISGGYAYQIMAYTDEAFCYSQIVFTGLPQISIFTSGEITTQDSPVRVQMSAYGEEPLDTSARIHLRGASSLYAQKKGYRLEFTRERGGAAKKIGLQAPGFGWADDLVLLSGLSDDTKMRERLSWDVYGQIAADDEAFGGRTTAYAEVYVDNAYAGVYLMMEPVDLREELALGGEKSVETDYVYRTAVRSLARDRQVLAHPRRVNTGYELYYAPRAGHEFDAIESYVELMLEEDDAAFCQKALACIDLDSMLRYVLYVQAAGLTDNVFNNMYIWAHRENDGYVYRFAPWDVDLTWGLKKEDIGEEFENWMIFPIADRMLNLNAGGARERLYAIWQEMRKGAFSEANLEALIARYTHELGSSGALARDAMRWGMEMYDPDGYEILTFASMRLSLLDEVIAGIGEGGTQPVGFLSDTDYERKGVAMTGMSDAEE